MDNLDLGRMMHHYGSAAFCGYPQQQQQQQSSHRPSPHHSEAASDQQQAAGGEQQQAQHHRGGHADISAILDQIMNITDQSLDEAQACKMVFKALKHENV